ncbi:protein NONRESPONDING TO OXYLIPINS 2, mitochondrial-like isoform X1 [Zingiber officinale]|uniref:Uncharacterized protein n=2 Tax=Zingiber officinale TaxID=94328 RepID=A0A8J5G7Y5_ZINOF|nr:protein NONRESPONDING TO OXYLIPINS 2, mitochondrial-like isoform X1 [Zingiber officinale]KAG6502188.1 hypothetical protein ZIOFF_042077 [Zingiber officinale]
MAWRGSFSRSLLAAARSSAARSTPAAARAPPSAVPRLQRRQPSFASPRNLGELGCMQSFLPLYSTVAAPRLTSHLSASVRECCELSQGTFRRTCQDR